MVIIYILRDEITGNPNLSIHCEVNLSEEPLHFRNVGHADKTTLKHRPLKSSKL